jgi:hypothetical protein
MNLSHANQFTKCTGTGSRIVAQSWHEDLRSVLPHRQGLRDPRRAVDTDHPSQPLPGLHDLQRDRRGGAATLSRATDQAAARARACRGDRHQSQTGWARLCVRADRSRLGTRERTARHGGWADKWMDVTFQHSDPDVVLWSWCQTFWRAEELPDGRVVVRFDFQREGRRVRLWLLVHDKEVEICRRRPGFEEDLIVAIVDPHVFAKWHLGLVGWDGVLRSGGVRMEGRKDLARALPTWNAAPQAHKQRRIEKGHAGGGYPGGVRIPGDPYSGRHG